LTTTLMTALLLRANQVVESAHLVNVLWPAELPPSANANLRQYVSRLRAFLRAEGGSAAAERVGSISGGYRITTGPDELDLSRFETLAVRGRQAYGAGDLLSARGSLDRALREWDAPLCQGVRLTTELEVETRYWEDLRFNAQILLRQIQIQTGDHHLAVAGIRALIAVNPLCEELWGMLMVALYRSYRRGEALEVFREAYRRWVQELGIEPSVDLLRLHQQILRGETPQTGFAWLSTGVGAGVESAA
jgi:SARP family transcriptional regulator, regulator of embCAB operon